MPDAVVSERDLAEHKRKEDAMINAGEQLYATLIVYINSNITKIIDRGYDIDDLSAFIKSHHAYKEYRQKVFDFIPMRFDGQRRNTLRSIIDQIIFGNFEIEYESVEDEDDPDGYRDIIIDIKYTGGANAEWQE